MNRSTQTSSKPPHIKDIFHDRVITWRGNEEIARRAGGLSNLKKSIESACQSVRVFGIDNRWGVQLSDWNQTKLIEQIVKNTILSRESEIWSTKSLQRSLPDPHLNPNEFRFAMGEKFPCMVQIYTADITKVVCDAVVNAANGKLRHIAGVARAISAACGPDFQTESSVAVAQRGGLLSVGEVLCQDSCGSLKEEFGVRFVVHAVGPDMDKYHGQTEQCYQKLFLAVKSSMELADSNKCRSVAIPAISSGIFGVPMSVCTRAYWEALRSFVYDADKRRNLREIHFVNITDTVTRQIIDAFRKYINSTCYVIS